ncbi:MAG TPA: tetratricopeptide repeat protein [Actinocrinis sp.]|uniref:ATP-binding protein n=1 Tax=Actinocrinis sp. TaxID=1920516 RepID=UPI002DDCE3AD|nr:tetratricopeptide repeat protein [Actinocrinis sp.]HEV2345074.1 tetratricopeptide repeat protein [Actinocrinis sp.]
MLDVQQFNKLVRQATREREAYDDEQAAVHLREALDCWHGNTTALIDLDADWLRRQADVLAQRRLDALGMLAEIHLNAGRPDESVALLRDAALLHPGRETLAVTLVQALTAAGESVQAAQIAARAARALIDLGQEPGPALREAQTAALTHRTNNPPPRNGGGRFQLPADTRVFTGRTTELSGLLGLLPPPHDPGPAHPEMMSPVSAPSHASPGLIAIDGMAGIGKSALAVHLAHRLAERYPDGHLFADLHGYTRGYPPRAPADVLDGFLRALGVMPEYVPDDLDQCAALFRSRLRGTRTLILLDNARSESQVRPLLPSTPECLVLITSRKRLKGLDDAHSLSLELMPTADAVALFRAVAGPGQIPAGDPALDEIINLCAHLPLALRIAAALLHHRPAWRLDHLAGLLRGQRDRLAALSDGERDLSAVFDLSYDALADGSQQLYHRLGVHPGPDVDGYAAAAMLADNLAAASRGLEELVDHNLLSEPVPGRYRFHDLIRAHAQERAVRLGCASPTPDPSPLPSSSTPQPPTLRSLDLVRTRLFDYYLSTAQAADRHLARRTTRYSIPIAYPPREQPALETRGQAAEWMRTELPNLAACVEEALVHGKSEHVIALSAALHGYLYIEGPWSYALSLHARAAEAAESIGDAYGQATALHSLGRVRRQVGDYVAGEQAQRRSLALYRQIGHAQGEANALDGLGRIFLLTAGYSSAVQAFDQALALLEQVGDLLGQAGALNGLGRVRRLLGDPAGAVEAHRRAFDLCRTADDPISQATALNDLGRAYEQIGDLIAADSAQQQALKHYLDTGHQLGQANVLRDQGRILRRAGKSSEAARAQERALELYALLGHRLGQADTLKELGLLRQQAGDTRAATTAYRRALTLFREMRDRRGEAETLNRHASALIVTTASSAAVASGDARATSAEMTQQARSLYVQALDLARAIDAPVEEADAREGIGETYASEEGGSAAAVESLNEALAIRRRLGLPSDHLVSRIEQLAQG